MYTRMKALEQIIEDIPRMLSEARENEISRYKNFYKKNLRTIPNTEDTITILETCIRKLESLPLGVVSEFIDKKHVVESKIKNIIEDRFNENVLSLFNKNVSVNVTNQNKKQGIKQDFSTILKDICVEMNDSVNIDRRNKINYLNFLKNCLEYYGLHPDINIRDPKVYKKYNIIVEHYFRSPKVKVQEGKIFQSLEHITNDILDPYEAKRAVKMNGILIPFKDIYRIKITSTLFQEDEVELLALKNKFEWSHTSKDLTAFNQYCLDETDRLLKNPESPKSEKYFRNNSITFIHPDRIKELGEIKNQNIDLVKLIQLCVEINIITSLPESKLGPAIYLRTIIDHIPTIFNFFTFKEFANNYKEGNRSFMKAMQKLDTSMRNMADNNLHAQARKKEILPTKNQFDYSQEIDLLLSEVVRVLK